MGAIRRRGGVWWVRYCRNGKRHEESSGSTVKQTAIDLLKIREGDGAHGVPVTAKISRFRFDEAAADLVTEYQINDRASRPELERRIRLHLTPFFRGRRMATITTSDVRAYVAHRQAAGIVAAKGERKGERVSDVSNASINRELTILKRMFTLALQADKLLRRPYIPLLEERNTRTGFFELEALRSVMAHLPAPLRPVMEFAYITGWRVPSEVLRLEWRQIDFPAGEIRLDPETTKNREGRVFPMTDDLRALLLTLHAAHEQRKKAGQIVPWVFVRLIAKGRAGRKRRARSCSLRRLGKRPASRPGARAGSRMIFGAPRSATWCGAGYRSA